MNQRPNILELRALARLAFPLAAAQAGQQLMGVVDTAVVGRLGASALGAVGLANSLFFAISIVAIGILTAIDPLTAQAVGAGDLARARRFFWQGVWISVGVGALFAIPLFLSPPLLGLIGLDPALTSDTGVYLQIRAFSLVPMLLYIVCRSYLQAQNITRPMLVAVVAANVVNLLLNILLVFGGSELPSWLGILRNVPAMGIRGSAIATLLATLLQLLAVIGAVARSAPAIPVSRRPNRRDTTQALRVGIPIGLQWGAEVGIFALVGVLAARLGSSDVAAHQVVIALASFTFTVTVGIGAAASVRVGQAIGAGDAIGTRRAGLVAIGAGAFVMILAALTFLLFPAHLAAWITNDPGVIATAMPLMMIAALFQLFDGMQAVGAGVLRGAGDTRFALLVNLFGHWFVGFPIAMVAGFYFGLGVVGLWWGLCAGLMAVAVLLLLRFMRLSRTLIHPITARASQEAT